MKIKLDIECTPEEARTFFGLPDVKPMQEMLLHKIEERMVGYLEAMTPEALLKTWLPAGAQSLEQLQKMFWSGLSAAQSRTRTDK
jgi:hypothetical protein